MPTNINTILDWFKTGKKPTQAQFWDTFKSFWHKDEIIPQTTNENLDLSLESKANNISTLSYKGEIPNAANLDDYTLTGIYLQGLNSEAASGQNYPLATAGKLEVVSDSSNIYQLYHAYGSANIIYHRTFTSGETWSPWVKIGEDMMKGDIPNGADLNNYTKTGFYLQGADVYAQAGANYPEAHAGQLEVVGNPDFIYQKYHVYGPNNVIYYRTFYSPSGWFPWKKITDSGDLANAVIRRGAVENQNANTDFEQTTGYWNYEGQNGNPSNFYINGGYGNFIVIGSGTFNTQIQYMNDGDMAHRTKYYLHDWATRNWRRVWDNYNLTDASQLNTDDLLHKSGDEVKSGSITIDGNNKGYYLGNSGNNASIIYNSNGNLDITPRAGYNTVFTTGKVGIGTDNPLQEFVVASPENGDGFEIAVNDSPNKVYLQSYNRNTNSYIEMQLDALKTILGAQGNVIVGNTLDLGYKLNIGGNTIISHGNNTDYKILTISNPAYDAASVTNGENRLYFQWADFEAGYIGSYKNTFNTSGLTFATQYGYGNVAEKMRLTPDGMLLLGINSPITGDKLQVFGDATFKSPNTWGGLNLDSSSVTGGHGLSFFGGGVMYSQVTGEYLSPDNGTSIFRTRQNGHIIENMRIVGETGNVLINTPGDNGSGSKLQVNGRASGEPAISPNEFVTKSQIEGINPLITGTTIELTIPSIGGFNYYEEYPYFEGAAVGDFVEVVIPLSFNIPFLDIKCLCVDDNKLMLRFTVLSQNYFAGGTDKFKFRIIK